MPARCLATTAVLAALLAPCTGSRADPGYYVVTAYDNEGRKAVDFRYWTVKHPGTPVVVWPELGFSWGLTSRWTTGLLASWIGSAQMPTQRSSLNWSNDVLLTQGEWPVDVALHLNWIVNADRADGDALEFGPVLQTDVGRTQLNANLIFERRFQVADPGPTRLKYQWQARHRASGTWHVGVQGFGELGPWDRWSLRDRQSHRAGPALFADVPLGDGRSLQAQAAYLAGSIYGERGGMFSMRVLYAF